MLSPADRKPVREALLELQRRWPSLRKTLQEGGEVVLKRGISVVRWGGKLFLKVNGVVSTLLDLSVFAEPLNPPDEDEAVRRAQQRDRKVVQQYDQRIGRNWDWVTTRLLRDAEFQWEGIRVRLNPDGAIVVIIRGVAFATRWRIDPERLAPTAFKKPTSDGRQAPPPTTPRRNLSGEGAQPSPQPPRRTPPPERPPDSQPPAKPSKDTPLAKPPYVPTVDVPSPEDPVVPELERIETQRTPLAQRVAGVTQLSSSEQDALYSEIRGHIAALDMLEATLPNASVTLHQRVATTRRLLRELLRDMIMAGVVAPAAPLDPEKLPQLDTPSLPTTLPGGAQRTRAPGVIGLPSRPVRIVRITLDDGMVVELPDLSAPGEREEEGIIRVPDPQPEPAQPEPAPAQSPRASSVGAPPARQPDNRDDASRTDDEIDARLDQLARQRGLPLAPEEKLVLTLVARGETLDGIDAALPSGGQRAALLLHKGLLKLGIERVSANFSVHGDSLKQQLSNRYDRLLLASARARLVHAIEHPAAEHGDTAEYTAASLRDVQIDVQPGEVAYVTAIIPPSNLWPKGRVDRFEVYFADGQLRVATPSGPLLQNRQGEHLVPSGRVGRIVGERLVPIDQMQYSRITYTKSTARAFLWTHVSTIDQVVAAIGLDDVAYVEATSPDGNIEHFMISYGLDGELQIQDSDGRRLPRDRHGNLQIGSQLFPEPLRQQRFRAIRYTVFPNHSLRAPIVAPVGSGGIELELPASGQLEPFLTYEAGSLRELEEAVTRRVEQRWHDFAADRHAPQSVVVRAITANGRQDEFRIEVRPESGGSHLLRTSIVYTNLLGDRLPVDRMGRPLIVSGGNRLPLHQRRYVTIDVRLE